MTNSILQGLSGTAPGSEEGRRRRRRRDRADVPYTDNRLATAPGRPSICVPVSRRATIPDVLCSVNYVFLLFRVFAWFG